MSFAAETRERIRPVLPLAGMVDVLFLLLIFFMTTSVFREQEFQIEVAPPSISSDRGTSNQVAYTITIDAEGEIYIGDRRYDLASLKQTLEELHATSPGEKINVRGDQDVLYGRVVKVFDIAHQAGFTSVSYAVKKDQPSVP